MEDSPAIPFVSQHRILVATALWVHCFQEKKINNSIHTLQQNPLLISLCNNNTVIINISFKKIINK